MCVAFNSVNAYYRRFSVPKFALDVLDIAIALDKFKIANTMSCQPTITTITTVELSSIMSRL